MKIKVIATYVIEEFENKNYIPEEYIIEIESDSSLNDLKRAIGLEGVSVSFDKYYVMNSRELVSLEDTIPFKINKDQKIEWECSFDEVTIEEFIRTNQIDINEGIYIEYGYPQAGGPRIF